ncbi:uncharacterized protein BDW43DRAFT_315946 [Aspergillus alliaceus]|uniref:uncharacterized protein n=1 Tax=Petromyces alliaceus TaxID=209559 RepID=UPI0012A73FE1|nr:uncharacterized protein BDW43DRAFT_315946 [Aspergillus alliaceus]KAB8228449.1 hypothetical protein BDW43DRAFT_315946 [Aspergillus alliaceus]
MDKLSRGQSSENIASSGNVSGGRVNPGDGISHDPGMEVKDMEVPECQKDHVNGSDVRDIIEKERLKGLKYAESWVELESLHDAFLGEGEATNGVVAMGGLNDIAGGGFSFP